MHQPSPDRMRQEKAREYARKMRLLSFEELALGAIFLAVFALSGLSVWLRDLLKFPQPLAVALYFALMMAAYGIITSPLSYYQGFLMPHRYGLSRERLGDWLRDRAKGGLLGLALGAGAVVVIYQLLSRFPDLWWMAAAAFLSLLSAGLTLLAPILILPLFFELRPLEDTDLRQKLVKLAEQVRFKASGVYTMNLSRKGTTANAMLLGLGSTRRIVLSDTLLQDYSPEEVETIMAHELGHHRLGHILRLLSIQSVLALASLGLAHLALRATAATLGLQGMSDVATLPLLALAIAASVLILAPALSAYSRHL
ncbi:MAG: M48 family metalloprotease, partial [Dehalococcoidia bacterium]